jgi:hypothetical protein
VFERDVAGRVMIPAYARPAHRRLREKLAEITAWAETGALSSIVEGDPGLGIVTSGISYHHAREAAPGAAVLKLGVTYPFPVGRIRKFAAGWNCSSADRPRALRAPKQRTRQAFAGGFFACCQRDQNTYINCQRAKISVSYVL